MTMESGKRCDISRISGVFTVVRMGRAAQCAPTLARCGGVRRDRGRSRGRLQRGQFRRDTTAKLIAIEPVTGRGGASFIASIASPKRKRWRPSARPARSVRRFGAGVSVAATAAHDVSVGHSHTGSSDMAGGSGKGMPVLNVMQFDQ
ncbi:hypothetical protein ACRS8P_10560 [Burkholderia cenocepacia]